MPPMQHQQQLQSPRQGPSVLVSQAPKESAPAGTKRKGGPGGLTKSVGSLQSLKLLLVNLLFPELSCLLSISSRLIHQRTLVKRNGQKLRETKTETENTEPVASSTSAVALSEPLAKFFGTGETEMTEEEIIRRVWEYIKLNNLEDQTNPMAIQCDEKLRDLIGCEKHFSCGDK
ncbi:hypothetical protein Rs2_13699 [Raphanus sativus]|nr:hypothetical protein Rs2_13699 [Raphanus sativus]